MHKVILAFIGMLPQFAMAQTALAPANNCNPIANKKEISKMKQTTDATQKNVLGTNLQLASTNPITGFYRNGYCKTGENDRGIHVVAAVLTKAFLEYSKAQGNDLITPNPAYGFVGLKPGNTWCLCAARWKQAYLAGVAPPVVLEATHSKALEYATLAELKSVPPTTK